LPDKLILDSHQELKYEANDALDANHFRWIDFFFKKKEADRKQLIAKYLDALRKDGVLDSNNRIIVTDIINKKLANF